MSIKVTFVQPNDEPWVVDAPIGSTLMEAAVKNGVPGIQGDCGGACSCATCHVYVDPDWSDRTGVRDEIEEAMLDFADGVTPQSRLGCQIAITELMDGLIVRLPA
jgi:2Fe-2S ferredoxin